MIAVSKFNLDEEGETQLQLGRVLHGDFERNRTTFPATVHGTFFIALRVLKAQRPNAEQLCKSS